MPQGAGGRGCTEKGKGCRRELQQVTGAHVFCWGQDRDSPLPTSLPRTMKGQLSHHCWLDDCEETRPRRAWGSKG